MASLATPVVRFSEDVIVPFRRLDLAIENAIRLAVSTTFRKGQILAQLTGTNEIQTLTIGGTPTGGTFAIGYTGTALGTVAKQTTAPITWSATNATLIANILAALQALPGIQSSDSSNVLVAALSLTSGIGTINVTFVNGLGGLDINQMTADATLLTGTSPTTAFTTATAGVAGANGLYQAYNSGGSDGTQNAKCILRMTCTTDANGLITLGDGTLGNDNFSKVLETSAYFGGIFRCDELFLDNASPPTALNSTVVTSLGGTVIEGTVTARGILSF